MTAQLLPYKNVGGGCVSSIFVLTICFKLINLIFHIFHVFVFESSSSFLSYIVQIVSISLAQILKPLKFSLLPWI